MRAPPFTSLASVYDEIMQDVPYAAWVEFALRGAVLRGWGAGLLRSPGAAPLPKRSHQAPGWRGGTYRGSIAVAHFLRRVQGAQQLRHRIEGWREATGG